MSHYKTATELRGIELDHAYVCLAFYSGLTAARDTIEELGFKFKGSSLAGDVHEWIVYTNDSVYFCLNRGTDEPNDWWTNIAVRKKLTPWGRIHRGFFKAFNHVSYRQAFLKTLPVVFTGHSKGAAVSAISALSWNGQALLWGMPKVGDRAFQIMFDNQTTALRIVHSRDPVPWTPFINYYHVGNVIKRTSSKRCLRQHYMSNYVRSHPDFDIEKAPRHIKALLA